jgi:predicted hydrocarbon binding protein/KaiC/GvpD/RAD55 family RecA-like ATPase
MEQGRVSLSDIQEAPNNSLVLLSGPPGAGKSTFCHQVVMNSLAADTPVLFVTTERSVSDLISLLEDKGLGRPTPGALTFVDAFATTVGLNTAQRPDTVDANCEDLNSISMAIDKLQRRVGRRDTLLAFDSLTSPYLFNRQEIFRFMRLSLAKFAAQGNSVLALVDEGCGAEEDLVAMMSVADGIITMEIRDHSRTINVVKHPRVVPTKIETPITRSAVTRRKAVDPEVGKRVMQTTYASRGGKPARTEVGDFVHIFWRNLASWSGMLWDPKRFPHMGYELGKEHEATATSSMMKHLSWPYKLLFKAYMPKSLSETKDMKKVMSRFLGMGEQFGIGKVEYVEDVSREDDHHFRLHESSSCWGFEDAGARLAFHDCGEWAGSLKALERGERDWNVVETKCIGLGDPYCEFKAVPGEIGELNDTLEGIDNSVVARVHDRLMSQLTGFLIAGKPLTERPGLGSGVSFHEMHHVTGIPALFSERYRMALRMGGARAGKVVGEHLLDAGMGEDEVLHSVIDLMEHCKVGKITLGETIRMWENCETFGLETGEPSCYFTTGFLNGLYSAVKGRHVREVRCIGAGDPYCEWEIK